MPSSFRICLRALSLSLAPVLGGAVLTVLAMAGGGAFQGSAIANAQPAPGQAIKLESDVQEANAKTGVITARGNVRINYPARQIQATAAQALYYSREKRIILSGNVYVLQQGNSLRGETITYLIDEGRFIALPQPKKQVESIYLVPEAAPAPTTPVATPFGTQSEFPAGSPNPAGLIP